MHLITRKQAAALLRVCLGRLDPHRQHGCGPAYIRMERRVRYAQRDLPKFLRYLTIVPALARQQTSGTAIRKGPAVKRSAAGEKKPL